MKYTEYTSEFTPEYCQYLYECELGEMEEHQKLGSNKWKNDVLLILLKHAHTRTVPVKKLRRKVVKDVEKECRRTYRIYSRTKK
jgi:hypothetical protein